MSMDSICDLLCGYHVFQCTKLVQYRLYTMNNLFKKNQHFFKTNFTPSDRSIINSGGQGLVINSLSVLNTSY